MEEIINKIEKSGLITLDLEDFYPQGIRTIIDIKTFLWQGLVLKEKEFRQAIKDHDWNQYQGNFVGLTCSEDTIIANWAYMLIASSLQGIAKRTFFGDRDALEAHLFDETISNIDLEQYRDKRILVKGCGSIPIPTFAYVKIVDKLQSVVKSLMYGEACSSVPIYKSPKKG